MFAGESGVWPLPGADLRAQGPCAGLWRDRTGQVDPGSRGPASRVGDSEEDDSPLDHDRLQFWLRNRWTRSDGDGVEQRTIGAIERGTFSARAPLVQGKARPGRAFPVASLLLALLILFLVLPLKDARPPDAAVAYNDALSLFQHGSLAESQFQAKSGFDRFGTSSPRWASKFRLLEAESMLWRGMYADALHELLSFRDDADSDLEGKAERLAIEAVALGRLQQVPSANQRLVEAEALCNDAAEMPACGSVLASRAIVEDKEGRLAEARQTFLQARGFASRHRDFWLQVSTALNLGWVDLQLEHYDEAVLWSKSAYDEAANLRYENLAQKAAGNLGWAYYQLGDEERALEQFITAEKSAARLGNVGSELGWINTAGYVYRDMGDWTSALQSSRRALDLAQQIQSREDIANALQDLAEISVDTGKLDEADSYIHEVAAMENGGDSHPSAILRFTMGELAVARGQYAKAEEYLNSVRNDSSSLMTTRLNADYELAVLYELQHNTDRAERMFQTTLAAYDAARAQLKSEESQLPFGTNAAQIYDSYIHLLVQQGRPDAALAVADESRARTLERALGGQRAGRQTRTRAINARKISQITNSTLLFYWLGENQSYLWAITPTKVALFTLPPRRQITARIERYRKALLDLRDPLEEENADGQALYQMLVGQASKMIRSGKQVIILDDGTLSKLNFETLLAPGPEPSARQNGNSKTSLHYLIEDFTLSSAPSLAMLAARQTPMGAARQMLLLGNPVSADRDFPSLPMFSFEMSRVGSHFTAKRVFSGPQATPASYMNSRPDQYSYIHFVSHAVASSTTPLDSAIILSNSAGQEGSYKLYAREIIQHPIHAKLVTISACYGSGTRTYAGEGLVGLSWAFLRAGAHQVIGALWEVSDDSTPFLMDRLYEGLEGGQSPTLALHNAKLKLLHSRNQSSLPFYWAPFQLYGRP